MNEPLTSLASTANRRIQRTLAAILSVFTGVCMTLSAVAAPPKQPAKDRPSDLLAWRVAPGIAAPAVGAKMRRRRRWCDLGKQVVAAMPAPFKVDPVFRRPTELLRAEIAVAMKEIERARPGSADEKAKLARITELIRGQEGPALLRTALRHPGSRGRTAALEAARPIVAKHPRLAGFATGDLKAKEPARARAAVLFTLAARCDTPALYAMDGLEHPHASVRETTLRGALRTAAILTDQGIMQLVANHIMKTEQLPRLRALYARGLGQLGWAPGTTSLVTLLQDKSALVRSEAMVAVARVTGTLKGDKWTKARTAVQRVAVIRALVAVSTTPTILSTLKRWRSDKRRAKDPLGVSRPLRVSDAAAEALAWHGALPTKTSATTSSAQGATR